MTVVVERGRCVGPNGQDFTRSFYFIGHPQCTGVRFIFLAVPKVGGCVIFTLQVLKWSWGGFEADTPSLELLRTLFYIAACYHKCSHPVLKWQAAASRWASIRGLRRHLSVRGWALAAYGSDWNLSVYSPCSRGVSRSDKLKPASAQEVDRKLHLSSLGLLGDSECSHGCQD